MVRGKLISSCRKCNTAALPRTWFLCFLLSSIIDVVVYFHEFHQKPATLDGDGIVISTAHFMSEQWHVSAISVKYREKYLKRRLMYSCSHPEFTVSAILGCIFSQSRSIYFKNFPGEHAPGPPYRTLAPAARAKNALGILYSSSNSKNAARSLVERPNS